MAFRCLSGNTTKTPSTSLPTQLITFVLLNYFTYTYLLGNGHLLSGLGLPPRLLDFMPLLIIVITFLYFTATKRIKVPYLFLIYTCFLGAILGILSLFSAPNPRYSCPRAIFAVCLLHATFGVFLYLNFIFDKQPSLRRMMLWSLLLGLIVSIVKDFYFPDPNVVSGLRFDGGADLDSNTVGNFALLSIFWAHYTALRDKHWDRVNQFTWAIGIYVLLLTASRGNIICLGIFYTLYLLVWGGQILIQSALKGQIPRLKKARVITTVIGTAVGTGTLIVAVNQFMSTSLFAFVVHRMGGVANEGAVGTRFYTVKILLDQVNDSNFWFGSMGWWYQGKFMEHLNYSDLAIHAHNAYVRLLIEVGFIGLVAVMLLPIYLFFAQIQRVVRLSRYGWTHELRISTLLLAMLFTLWMQQMVYQSYMTSAGTLRSSLVVFVMALVYHDFSEKIIKKSHHSKVTQKSSQR